MSEAETKEAEKPNAAVKTHTEEMRWPLSYCLQPPKPTQSSLQAYGFDSTRDAPRRWWSHTLYRGPGGKEVEILYSRTKAQSEIIAQHFLKEPILGFDMEWPWNDWKRKDLQNKVGLIQIASESKIGLFHIGLHPGKTTEDIIAPTLRRIIESPSIGKVGVNILRADFGRLNRFFHLKPKGAIESSHLYRLVKFGPQKPELVSIKLVSLAHQVEDQLGLPLYKGDVRTSNWSKPLSKDQIKYAAGDAYAGYMLYHCANAKRLAMKPRPPLPIYAENYPKGKASKDDPILLDTGGGTTTTTEAFFGVKPAKSGSTDVKDSTQKKVPAAKSSKAKGTLDTASFALYESLYERRATLAEKAKVSAYRIISDALLESLAVARPCDTETLLAVKGIGKVQQKNYGDEWLKVISQFLTTNGLDEPVQINSNTVIISSKDTAPTTVIQQPRTPRSSRTKPPESADSSPAFDTPPPRTPQLHTGLSFTMAETNIVASHDASSQASSNCESDTSLPSLDFGSPTRRSSAQLKRKRAESPVKVAPDIMQQPAQIHQIVDAPQSRAPPSCTLLTTPPPLSPASRLARNKLFALSKLITRKIPARPLDAPPIVTEHTLDLIIRTAPRTQDDLENIPGVDTFLLACEQTGTDLLKNVVKFGGWKDPS